MSRRSFEDRKRQLDKQQNLCHWCHKPIQIYHNIPQNEYHADQATIDHVYTHNDPRRIAFKKAKIPSPFVMACPDCNKRRGGKTVEKWESKLGRGHQKWKVLKSEA